MVFLLQQHEWTKRFRYFENLKQSNFFLLTKEFITCFQAETEVEGKQSLSQINFMFSGHWKMCEFLLPPISLPLHV